MKPAAGLATLLLYGTVLAGVPVAAFAQTAPAEAEPEQVTAPEPVDNTIRTISVVGAERLEAQTILSYIRLRVGQEYTSAGADAALKDLGATELTRGYGWVWSVSGWLLTPFMKRAGPEVAARMRKRVLDQIDTTFVSHYSSRISLAQAITVEAVKDYGARRTGQKTLLRMA